MPKPKSKAQSPRGSVIRRETQGPAPNASEDEDKRDAKTTAAAYFGRRDRRTLTHASAEAWSKIMLA
jgi:hypothetical protein